MATGHWNEGLFEGSLSSFPSQGEEESGPARVGAAGRRGHNSSSAALTFEAKAKKANDGSSAGASKGVALRCF